MDVRKNLVISSISFTITLVLWPVLMGIAQPSGSLEEQLVWISEHLNYYKIQFLLAFLIGPTIIYLMISQIETQNSISKVASRIGLVFLVCYLVFVSTAYLAQVIFTPAMIKEGLTDQAKIWYFGSPYSIAYFINQMGYFFWAIGTIILFRGLLMEKGIVKAIGILYMISALLSILAFVGLIFESDSLNSLTLLSGLLLLPVGILSIIWGFNAKPLTR